MTFASSALFRTRERPLRERREATYREVEKQRSCRSRRACPDLPGRNRPSFASPQGDRVGQGDASGPRQAERAVENRSGNHKDRRGGRKDGGEGRATDRGLGREGPESGRADG